MNDFELTVPNLYDVMEFLQRCAKARHKVDKYYKQECIPVGCIPATHWLYPGGSASGPPEHPPWLCAWTSSHSISPLAVGLNQIPLNFPLGSGPGPDPPQFPPYRGPGWDPPQFPPWLWAWARSPSISPLAVGLETPTPWEQKCPWEQTPREQTPPRSKPPGSRHPPGRKHPPGADTPRRPVARHAGIAHPLSLLTESQTQVKI